MLSDHKDLISRWHGELSRPATLEVVLTEDDRSTELTEFCEALSSLAPKVTVKKTKDGEGLPAIRLLANLQFIGVPSGRELEPFLEMTAAVAKGLEPVGPDEADLSGLDLPAELELFVASQCIHCPAMVRRIYPLAAGSELVRVSIIDAERFDEKTKEAGIQSVPTLVLDGKFRWSGGVPLADVARMILSRDPTDLSASALQSFLQEGKAGKIAEMMIDHQAVFPALVDLLTHEKWPRRLGAMVAMETAAESDPALAAKAVPALVDRLDGLPEDVKGDVVYILGEIGGPDLVPLLEKIAAEESSTELVESAEEALERIRNK